MSSTNRRKFLKDLGIGSVTAGLMPSALVVDDQLTVNNDQQQEQHSSNHEYNGSYSGEYLSRIAFPLGGIGAGMFCLEGTGAISHMSVRNKPDVFNEPGIFAAISIKGWKNGAKILEGPVPDWKKFGLRDAGNGLSGSTAGLPRFEHAVFLARFPFATIDLIDPELPIRAQLTGWSPFIPSDDDNSSLPTAALEYKIKNTSLKTVDVVFSFNSKNFLGIDKGKSSINKMSNGFILSETGTKDAPSFKTDFAVFTDDSSVVVDYCWFRGGWWDPLTMTWNVINKGDVRNTEAVESNAPGASLFVPFKLAPGKEKTIKVMMAWYAPESDMNIGAAGQPKENCDPAAGCCASPDVLGLDKYDKNFDAPFYKPWYSSKFSSINEVAEYWRQHYDELRKNSSFFKDAFYSSSLPAEIIEAVAANLTILKSPTVLRQYDGRLWSWEGCADNFGCCHGSCTHVWNYAQAFSHLFPALERSLRHTEFCEDQSIDGHQTFRARLPIKPADHGFHAAADGQLGGIMKVYREWRISGDSEWVRKMYPMVKTSLDYCIRVWDPDHKGVIEEPHHNTYDIEFWGADGMHTSFYIGALSAIIAMGKFLNNDVTLYEAILQNAKRRIETDLYDGEYFIQKIQFTGLKAPSPAEAAKKSYGGEYSKEAIELLEKEGPKYQYGKGCLSDGVLGFWIARMCGLNDVIDTRKIQSHLRAVHKYNLKNNLRDHANPQRPSYAFGNEGGLLLCTWPKGGKLSLPFVYSDEVWTGIEHQVASHLMMMGDVQKGLEIVRTSRNRYDGRVRNPFNEYECGHWYARALSSYGYLQALTGVRYDAVEKTLFIDSKIGDFTSFLSTEMGFGTVTFKQGKATVKVAYGKIEIEKTVIEKTS